MTSKQKLRSIEKKMERIQKWYSEIDLKEATKHYAGIEKYYKLTREHLYLKFQIEHCSQCGKKL